MLKEIFYDSFENFETTRICVKKPYKRDWMAKVVSHTNAFNFLRPLQSLLLRSTAENAQVS